MKAQRDVFLELLLEEAKRDHSVMLLSADMGAPAIDLWKEQLPGQYLAMGISEQNTINVAAGLSRGGKKVFVYFMAVWVHRCFEQIRYSCTIAGNKISIVGNGVGLGYAPAGPAHEPNEDVAVMRSLHDLDIYSASSSRQMKGILKQCLDSKKSNYVRLERRVHKDSEEPFSLMPEGFFQSSYSLTQDNSDATLAIISYGQIINRIREVINENPRVKKDVKLIELSKLWPLDVDGLVDKIKGVNQILFIEEQSKSGSLAEAITYELLVQGRDNIRVESIHLPNNYIFENGNQDELLDEFGFSKEEMLRKILLLLGKGY